MFSAVLQSSSCFLQIIGRLCIESKYCETLAKFHFVFKFLAYVRVWEIGECLYVHDILIRLTFRFYC